jgi:hypothetical protein
MSGSFFDQLIIKITGNPSFRSRGNGAEYRENSNGLSSRVRWITGGVSDEA